MVPQVTPQEGLTNSRSFPLYYFPQGCDDRPCLRTPQQNGVTTEWDSNCYGNSGANK